MLTYVRLLIRNCVCVERGSRATYRPMNVQYTLISRVGSFLFYENVVANVMPLWYRRVFNFNSVGNANIFNRRLGIVRYLLINFLIRMYLNAMMRHLIPRLQERLNFNGRNYNNISSFHVVVRRYSATRCASDTGLTTLYHNNFNLRFLMINRYRIVLLTIRRGFSVRRRDLFEV